MRSPHDPIFFDNWGDLIIQQPWETTPAQYRARYAWCPECEEKVQLDHSSESRNVVAHEAGDHSLCIHPGGGFEHGVY